MEDSGLAERDPDPAPINGPAEAPRFTTDRPRNLTPEAAEREKRAVVEQVKKAREARKEQLADPVETTAADLDDDPPEAEQPTTDPNGPNHGEDPDVNRMGRFNDNGAGMSAARRPRARRLHHVERHVERLHHDQHRLHHGQLGVDHRGHRRDPRPGRRGQGRQQVTDVDITINPDPNEDDPESDDGDEGDEDDE